MEIKMLKEGQTVYFIPDLFYEFEKDNIFVRQGTIIEVGDMVYTIVETIKTQNVNSVTYTVPYEYVFLNKSEAEKWIKEAKVRLYEE